MHAPPLNSIAFVGSYVPRRCGIATYTADLRTAVATHLPAAASTLEVISGSDFMPPRIAPQRHATSCR